MSLRNVNLNLLPILRSLLATASVSRTAAELHLSQPTVSDGLARLRALLNDQLLVRIGSGMKLTQRAMDLIEPVESVCTNLESLLRLENFNPSTQVRDLAIATSDICAYMLLRRVLNFVRREAPRMTLHVTEIDSTLRDKMASGKMDFALLPDFAIEHLAPAPLRFAPLAQLSTSLVMCRSHPLADRHTISPEDLLPYPLVAFHPDPVLTHPKSFDNRTLWHGLDLKIEVRISQMLLIPQLLAGSTSVAFITRHLAEDIAATSSLVIHDNPFPEVPVQVGLVWSPVFDADPVHRWIRESLAAQVASELDPQRKNERSPPRDVTRSAG